MSEFKFVFGDQVKISHPFYGERFGIVQDYMRGKYDSEDEIICYGVYIPEVGRQIYFPESDITKQ